MPTASHCAAPAWPSTVCRGGSSSRRPPFRLGCRLSVSHKPGESVGCLQRVLVLPYALNDPSRVTQRSGGLGVSRLVGCNLVGPPQRVRLRLAGVFGAAVPEAAVNEDGDLCLGKDDVDLPAARRPVWCCICEARRTPIVPSSVSPTKPAAEWRSSVTGGFQGSTKQMGHVLRTEARRAARLTGPVGVSGNVRREPLNGGRDDRSTKS